MFDWFYVADLFGVAVFALSGTLLAFRRRMDGFGVLVLASLTGIGGGTTRDLILHEPVFWLHDPTYFWVILAAAAGGVLWLRYKAYMPVNRLLVADALGISFFTVLGAEKALNAGVSGFTAVILGTMTAVFGGLLRDVVAREVPLVLKSELYATTCLIGGTAFVLLHSINTTVAVTTALLTTFVLRIGALKYHWSLIVFKDQTKY